MNKLPSEEEKFQTVIEKNTFFKTNVEFYRQYEVDTIDALKQKLLELHSRIKNSGSEKEELVKFMQEYDDGLKCVLILLGISDEFFQRLIHASRIVNKPKLNELLNLDEWDKKVFDEAPVEWSIKQMTKMARENAKVADGIANIIFQGSTIPILIEKVPIFEMKKLDPTKLKFSIESLIDTILRYRMKGSLTASKKSNAEGMIESILKKHSINYTNGKLPEVPDNITRTMDFIIPDKENPEIIIESSFMATTSSSMGDKSKEEIQMREEFGKHYPNAMFIGFNDGAGWLNRQSDLKRMVSGQDDVFTFHDDELKRFEDFILKEYPHLCNAEK